MARHKVVCSLQATFSCLAQMWIVRGVDFTRVGVLPTSTMKGETNKGVEWQEKKMYARQSVKSQPDKEGRVGNGKK